MHIATVRGIVVHEGKLLCVKIKDQSYWCLPGGKIEPNESIFDAFKREMVEELGIEPEIGELLYVYQYYESKEKEFIEFFVSVKNPQDYLTFDLSKTTHGELELDAAEFLDPRIENVLPKFLSAEADQYMSDSFSAPQFREEY